MPEEQIDDIGLALEGALGIEPAVEEEVVPGEEIDSELDTSPEEGEEEPGEEGDLDIDSLPANIKERAEALELDPSFFYDAAVTLNDGTSMTIGQLKDAVQAGGGSEAIQKQQTDILAQQQHMQAENALREQYGEPIRRYEDALAEIAEKYKSTNWKELTDEHGDKAELARIQMQQRYTQIQQDVAEMKGEYAQAMGGYAGQVAQAQLTEIIKTHPTWTDNTVAIAEMQAIHKAVAGTGITYEQMTNEVGGMGGAVKLAILELAAKGAAAGNIDPKKVRKVAKSLKGGRTISSIQQKRMQQAKALKAARGGTRKQQQQAAIDLIAANGGL